MTSRLEILQISLEKKERELNRRITGHFETVAEANGQPLNDKRNGAATLRKWDRQHDAIKTQVGEVEKTKAAIEREEGKIFEVESWYRKMPPQLTQQIDAGVLIQWRKHPRILFVEGVDKARIIFNPETNSVLHKYVSAIKDKGQYATFRDIYNGLSAELNH